MFLLSMYYIGTISRLIDVISSSPVTQRYYDVTKNALLNITMKSYKSIITSCGAFWQNYSELSMMYYNRLNHIQTVVIIYHL